jgi:Uma2 family endonuclease
MPTLVFDPQPGAIEELIAERAQLDLDRQDEVWEGVLHMMPPPSHAHERLLVKLSAAFSRVEESTDLELTGGVGIGTHERNYRVPDLALHRPGAAPQWHPTAALVLELRSPGDKAWEKLGFYAEHAVDEVVIIEPEQRRVHWLTLAEDGYRAVDRSRLVPLGPADLATALGWGS